MKDIAIEDFSYDLPDNRIAHYPLPERDSSRLLIFRDEMITEGVYRNIAQHLPSKSLMVFNNSRVIEARLLFSKPSGGKIEIFCLEPHSRYPGIAEALSEQGQVEWICLIGGASKWKSGQVLQKSFNYGDKQEVLSATYIDKTSEAFVVRFEWTNRDLAFADLLHLAGDTPLPPYIKRSAEISDSTRYQTVYANESGSVAAPTAGLHFTDYVMTSLAARGVKTRFVTLHVGAGTFKPVKATTMKDHEMHAEYIDVSRDLVNQLRVEGIPVTAVGTTSMRTIESLYWMGIKLLNAPDTEPADLVLGQWFAAEHASVETSTKDALQALENWMTRRNMVRLITKTQLLIAPGYRFRVASALVTNFHQPRSTLLLLVAALAGPQWRKIYDYALANDFRFLSYGDGCLIFRNDDGPALSTAVSRA